MHISDTLIDAASGGIVVPGEMQVDFSDPKMPEIASHRHVLLDFDECGLRCCPVTAFDRFSSGLAKVAAVEASLRFPYLTRKVFDQMLRPSLELQDCGMRFEGLQCGTLTQCGYLMAGLYNLRIGIVSSVDVTQRIDADGRTFRIEGTVTPSTVPADSSSVPPDKRFSICGTIPWVTLRLLGLGGAGWYHRHRPKGSQGRGSPAVPVPRTASSLSDLRSTGHGTDITRVALGSGMLLAGDIELRSPEKETTTLAREIVEIDLTEAQLTVRDADRSLLCHDGFCQRLGSYFSFTFTSLNANLVNGLFGADGTHAAATMSGTGLGRVNYDTGLSRGHGDYLGSIRQDIDHFDFTVDLTNSDLDLSLTGTLREFSGEDLRKFGVMFEEASKTYGVTYRKTFQQLMKPWVGFTIRARIPWLWLLIRGSPLAKRMPIG
jgi:hypothetical protein